MEKNKNQLDWGDIHQFNNEIDIQTEWLILRKKLQRKKKNRLLFLLLLSAASCFLLLVFLNGWIGHNNIQNVNNKKSLSFFNPENYFESISKTASIIKTSESTRTIKSKNLSKINKPKQTNNSSNNNSTIKQSNNLSSNNQIIGINSDFINHAPLKETTIANSMFNSTVLNQKIQTNDEELNSNTVNPIAVKNRSFEISISPKIILPEFSNQKIKILQQAKRLTAISLKAHFGSFLQNLSTTNKELNSYIRKRNAIERPLYEIGIATNLEFRLNQRFSVIGEFNFRSQTSHINQQETINYSEEKDDVLLEINRRPDGSEEQIRGKALVEVTKTIHADYFNSYQEVAFSSLIKYQLFNWKKSHFNMATGIHLGSYSWINGYTPDQKMSNEYISIEDHQNQFSILNNWMLRAEFIFDISNRTGISLYGQYSQELTNRSIDDKIFQNTSSFVFGTTFKRYL